MQVQHLSITTGSGCQYEKMTGQAVKCVLDFIDQAEDVKDRGQAIQWTWKTEDRPKTARTDGQEATVQVKAGATNSGGSSEKLPENEDCDIEAWNSAVALSQEVFRGGRVE